MSAKAIDPDILQIRVAAAGRAHLWPWWNLRAVSNPGWIIYAADRDGSGIVVRGRRYPLRGGRVLIVPPDTVFDSFPAPGVNQLYYHVDVLGLPAAAVADLASDPVDLGKDAILAAQAERLHAAIPDVGTAVPVIENHASMFLAALAFVHQAFSRLAETVPAARGLAWRKRLLSGNEFTELIQFIENHLGDRLYLSGLAERAGMGPQWLCTKFRAVMGLTPHQYILERRVAAAAQRLTFSDMGIDEVAACCGFTDRAHLSRAFAAKRRIGPAAYRARERLRLGRS